MNPCTVCWLRYGRAYTSECDTQCDYAKLILENKELKEKVKELEEENKKLKGD